MAASNALIYPLPSTAYRLYFWIQKTDGTLLNGVAWTGLSAGVGVTLYPDGSSTPLTYTGTPTQIGTTEWGYLDLLNTEIGTVKWFVGHVAVTNTGALQTPLSIGVLSSADVLPAVVQGASGGLPTLNSNLDVQADPQHWKGGLIPTPNVTGVPKVDMIDILGTTVSTPATAGVLDVNTKNINNVSASSVTTVNANVGTTQPQNFTGTGASALVKVDVTDIATAAVSTGTAQIGVNVVNIGGGASQGATGYVGTDQSKITNPTATVDLSGTTIKNVDNAIANVTLVATATNLTNAPTNGDFTAAMKTSLNASTPTSVTTVTGNVNGSVGSVLGNVAGTVASVVGNVGGNVLGSIGSLAAQAKTDVADAVLNAAAASYNVAGSIGALINLITSGSTSAAAVWNYLVSSAGTDITKMGGFIVTLLNAINGRVQAGTFTITDGFNSTGKVLTIVRYQTYSAGIGTLLELAVSVPTDPTGGAVYWTFKLNTTSQYSGTLVSYNSGTGVATFGLALTAAESGALPQLSGQFALSVVLPTSEGNLQTVPFANGTLVIKNAPEMPPA